MASTEIQIVNLPNFEKIQNFLNDSAYKEVLENSENFNTRLCIERRLRMPFLDPQTGVAQTHCALFMKQKQRMPGFRCGQIYTYPSMKWRKPKRQYLLHHQSYKAYQFREAHNHHQYHQGDTPAGLSSIDGSSMSASADNDSKDSNRNDEETKWYYDEMELSHVDDFEEDFESDVDFDESYNKSRKRRTKGNTRKNMDSMSTPAKRGRRAGRKKNEGGETRRRTTGGLNSSTISNISGLSIPPPSLAASVPSISSSLSLTDEPQMPILTPEQKIPPGEDSSDGQPLSTLAGMNLTGGSSSGNNSSVANIAAGSNSNSSSSTVGSVTSAMGTNSNTAGGNSLGPNSNTSNIGNSSNSSHSSKKSAKPRSERGKAQPSPYCDFCLGDARENKKTNLPEELVSCSDCGRSGHPTCLQFTPNMIISVKRYRWQCIECKYCSICGTSDNDDQLLFCDDCDRGYHMYCLQPPLTTPPEGSWSCKLCLEEFHSGKNIYRQHTDHSHNLFIN